MSASGWASSKSVWTRRATSADPPARSHTGRSTTRPRAFQALIDAGAEKVQDATDIGYGKIIAIAKDADGSMIGLLKRRSSR